MDNFLTDEELDQMFDEPQEPVRQQPQAPQAPLALPPPEPVPLYSLQLAQAQQQAPQQQAPQPNGQEGLLMKKLGPLPVWAWSLIGLGVGGTGFFAYRSMTKNPSSSGGDDESSSPKLGDIVSKTLAAATSTDSGSGWEPSRSRFAEQLERYYQRKGQNQHVKVWVDADEAKKDGGLKFVSPLVNIQVKHGTVKLDQALTRFCRREGLNPQQHPDGSIGLYPHSSKRGKEWEEYIDALRDDGQQT